MDETKKPLLIPPEFALYAEKHEIFDLYQVPFPLLIYHLRLLQSIFVQFLKRMLSQLLVHKPEEPMQFLIDFIKKDKNGTWMKIQPK